MPVTSFAIPFNWNSPLDPTRAASLGAILVESGHFVSSDGPRADVHQTPEIWMPGVTLPNIGERPSEYWRTIADPKRMDSAN